MVDPGNSRVHVVASDAGHLWIGIDGNADLSVGGPGLAWLHAGQMLIGPVDDVHPNITPQVNLMMLTRVADGANGGQCLVDNDKITNMGTAETSSWRSGGVAHPTASKGVMSFYAYLPNMGGQPNGLLATDTYDNREWSVVIDDSKAGPCTGGYLGNCTWMGLLYGVLSGQQNADKTRTAFGWSTTRYSWKNSIPWDGVTVPGGFSRDGVQF
jgi:hypothetical protein